MMPFDVKESLRSKGYALVPGAQLPVDQFALRYQADFAAGWNDLEPDRYLREGARFRERRYSRFAYWPSEHRLELLAHRPYFQSAQINAYAGGMQREVAPFTQASLQNPMVAALIELDFAQFPIDPALRELRWEIQAHQFRIIARGDELGEPTPEGIHRDEVDFGAMHLMSRVNAEGGQSLVYDNAKEPLTDFTLQDPLDTMYWADQQVLHAVTSIAPVDPARPAVRDIVIFGFESGLLGRSGSMMN